MNKDQLMGRLTRDGLLEVLESGDCVSIGARNPKFMESPCFHRFNAETSPQDFDDLYGYIASDGHFDFSGNLKTCFARVNDPSYLQYLKIVNGGSFFAGYLQLYGRGTNLRIGSIALANQDAAVSPYIGGLGIGHYFHDGSYIVLCESCVRRVSRDDFVELESWESFEDFYINEFFRLNAAFDDDLQVVGRSEFGGQILSITSKYGRGDS